MSIERERLFKNELGFQLRDEFVPDFISLLGVYICVYTETENITQSYGTFILHKAICYVSLTVICQ